MRAMVLVNGKLKLINVPKPKPLENQILIKVHACGVCRTDLHILDGDLGSPKKDLIPGHQIVGTAETNGKVFKKGDRIGVPWLGWTCGKCEYCKSERENLCDRAKFTGYTLDGGYAEHAVADEKYCFSLPDYDYKDLAPILCAGLIGYRALRMTNNAEKIGFYGLGSSAHILIQAVKGKKIFVFTRSGSGKEEFARKLGAFWVGTSDEKPPEPLDAAIVFAPVGKFMVSALRAVKKGGIVVSSGIHMSDIPSFPYKDLYGERILTSVTNLTRKDGEEFLKIAEKNHIKTEINSFPLEKANEALSALRKGKVGSIVLVI